MGAHIHGCGDDGVVVGKKAPVFQDNIRETGADLNLSEDPTEDDLGFETEED